MLLVFKNKIGETEFIYPRPLNTVAFDVFLQNHLGYLPDFIVVKNEDEELPKDRTFFDAFTLSGNRVQIDMEKARNIWRDRIRQERATKFAELDVAFMRAVERQDAAEQQRIAAEKHRLRDLTKDPEIEAAQTVDELKAFWPL